MTYAALNPGDPISVLPGDINDNFDCVLGKFLGPSAPPSPEPLQDWIDSDDPDCPWYIRNKANLAWNPIFFFGGGYAINFCTTEGVGVQVGVPDTGIATGYRLNLPVAVPAAGESMRVASIAGGVAQLEFFTAGASTLAMGSLTDVDDTGITDGQVLAWDATAGEYQPTDMTGGSGGASSLDGLSDVDITGAAAGHLLVRDGTSFKNRALVAGDIPDLSGTYLGVGSNLDDLADVSTTGHSAGDVIRSNGSSFAAGALVEADISDLGDYLPRAGGTLTGALTVDNQNALVLAELDANGSSSISLRSAAALAQSYTLTLPSDRPELADVWDPTGDVAANPAQVLAFDSTGAAFWIPVGSDATGGALVLSGTDEDLGAAFGFAGTINRPLLIQPQVDSWAATSQDHDGSGGPYTTGGGDGSNTLDLRYAAQLPSNGGGALVPQCGGTGRTSISAGSLLVGGSSATSIPAKPGVGSAENNGEAYTPMEEIGGTDGEFLKRVSGAWTNAPLGIGINDLSDVDASSPTLGNVLVYDGSNFAATNTLNGITVDGVLTMQGSSLPELRMHELTVAGSSYLGIRPPASMAVSYVLSLPATAPAANQILSTASQTGTDPVVATMEWATLNYPTQVATTTGGPVTFSGAETLVIQGGMNVNATGVDLTNTITFDFEPKGSALQEGDLLIYDSNNPVGFTRLGVGTEGQVLTVQSGVPVWASLPA